MTVTPRVVTSSLSPLYMEVIIRQSHRELSHPLCHPFTWRSSYDSHTESCHILSVTPLHGGHHTTVTPRVVTSSMSPLYMEVIIRQSHRELSHPLCHPLHGGHHTTVTPRVVTSALSPLYMEVIIRQSHQELSHPLCHPFIWRSSYDSHTESCHILSVTPLYGGHHTTVTPRVVTSSLPPLYMEVIIRQSHRELSHPLCHPFIWRSSYDSHTESCHILSATPLYGGHHTTVTPRVATSYVTPLYGGHHTTVTPRVVTSSLSPLYMEVIIRQSHQELSHPLCHPFIWRSSYDSHTESCHILSVTPLHGGHHTTVTPRVVTSSLPPLYMEVIIRQSHRELSHHLCHPFIWRSSYDSHNESCHILSVTPLYRAQNTRRHAALCRAAAVNCREALKMCGKCAARLAAMP